VSTARSVTYAFVVESSQPSFSCPVPVPLLSFFILFYLLKSDTVKQLESHGIVMVVLAIINIFKMTLHRYQYGKIHFLFYFFFFFIKN